MRLKHGLRALWRGQDEVQIGDDPRVAVRITLENPAEYEILRALEEDQTLSRLRRILTAAGGARERVDILVRQLGQAGLLMPQVKDGSAQFDIDASDRERLVAEAESRALLGGDGWGTPAARAHQRVSIYGLGRTGAGLALQLAAAGIGTLQLSDTSPVRPRDLGPVFIPALLGMPRDEALSRIINAHGYGCQVRTRGRWTQPDLAVMVDYEVANPTQASFLATHGVDHLSVVVGEVGISCGPWVRAGEGPCLRCVSLARRDEDPCWPGIAAQQHARSVVARRGEDSTLAALTATYATTQVLAALAGRAVAVAGRVLTYSLPDYALNWRDVAIHPACTEHNRRDLSGGPARRGGKGRQSPPPDQPDSEPEYTRQAA